MDWLGTRTSSGRVSSSFPFFELVSFLSSAHTPPPPSFHSIFSLRLSAASDHAGLVLCSHAPPPVRSSSRFSSPLALPSSLPPSPPLSPSLPLPLVHLRSLSLALTHPTFSFQQYVHPPTSSPPQKRSQTVPGRAPHPLLLPPRGPDATNPRSPHP